MAETLAGTTVRYAHEYDALDRLTHSTLAQGSPEMVSDLGRWQYDILGNRTRQTLADGRSLRYVYDEVGGQPQQAGAQQLRRIDLYSSAGALLGTDATLQWDAAGNLTGKSGTGYSQVFAWDADNRLRQSLTQVSTGSSTNTYDERYGYDAQERRLVRQMFAGGTLYVSQYLYSGEDIVKEYGASWTLPVAAYTHGAGTDEALLVQSSAGTRYYHADGLGTPGLLTDEAGATYAWRRHDAWGRGLGGAGTMPLYGYAGREPDPSSGLVYMRARYYDAALGRFISRDPIGLSGGLNVYAYVGSNPVNYVDPDGLYSRSVSNTQHGVPQSSTYYGSGTIGAPPSNVFNDTLYGRIAGDLIGAPLAAFTRNNVNPLTGYVQNFNGDKKAEVFINTVTLGIGPELRAGASAARAVRAERAILQGFVDDTVARFAADPAAALAELTVREARAVARNPRLTAPYFGNAVERSVATTIRENPALMDTFEHLSRPGRSVPDFASNVTGANFDITTNNARSFSDHLGRSYGNGLNILPYDRPSGFLFP